MIDATASGITSLDVYFNVPQSQLDILLITNPNGTSPREFTVVDDTLLTQRRVILTAAETATWLKVATDDESSPAAAPQLIGQLWGDLNGDRTVGSGDLAQLFTDWGVNSRSDLTGDTLTDAADMAQVLTAWGGTLAPMPDAATAEPAVIATDAALAQLTSEPTAILSPINRVITLTTTTPTSRRLRRSDSPPTDDTPQRATRRRTHVSRDAADVLFDRLITPDQSLSSE